MTGARAAPLAIAFLLAGTGSVWPVGGVAPTFTWSFHGGDAGGSRYAPFDQIRGQNVGELVPAWTYRTGELGREAAAGRKLTFEATPILFEGALYLSTAFAKIVALDPASGKERWSFDPRVDRNERYSEVTSRGVSAWRDPEPRPGQPCATRIFIGTIDARLIAVDAVDGAPCADFGEKGQVDLSRIDGVRAGGDYQVTSPPAVVDRVVVVGSSIGDNWHADTGRGVVRGFDARTGELLWSWDPIPHAPGKVGAANAWSILSADPERDLVFVPTSSPSPDFYGGLRPGDNRHANTVVALRASTGELVWSFQTVHHDLWDYDVAAQPVLVTVEREGKEIPAVAQATKMGFLFLLHRETGEPLFPVEEREVPASSVPGERSWPTQPFPLLPPALMPLDPLRPDDAWGIDAADRNACREEIARYRSEGIYTPPSLEGTIMYPGNASGTNWGSAAFDPGRGLLFLNTTRLATLVQLIPREDYRKVREDSGEDFEIGAQRGTPYGMRRKTLLSPKGLPCNPPPWGTLAAVDLASGAMRWEIPLGGAPSWHPLGEALEKSGFRGMVNGGGPMATAGGLVFIGASLDDRFRAFDADTGEEVWSVSLPASAVATPMSYVWEGRQYVVIAAGGTGKMDGVPPGDYVIAFALP